MVGESDLGNEESKEAKDEREGGGRRNTGRDERERHKYGTDEWQKLEEETRRRRIEKSADHRMQNKPSGLARLGEMIREQDFRME
eukprot:758707-Hanusia_phi.AAC.10